MSPLLPTIFIISGIDYRANGSLQLKVIKVDWNIDSLIFIKVTAGPFFFNPPTTRRLISVTHRSNLPARQQQGLKTGAVRRGEKVSVMDPDGFGFDSTVNYIGNSCTLINSPGVKQTVSLPLAEKSKVMPTLSLASDAIMWLCFWIRMNEGEKNYQLNEWVKLRLQWRTEEPVSLWRENYPSGTRDYYPGEKTRRSTMVHLCRYNFYL